VLCDTSSCRGVLARLLTPWSRLLIEKLTGSQSRNSPHFMEREGSLPAFTRAHHLSLSWARSIQFMHPSHFLKIRLNIILPCMPGYSKWSLSPRFPHQNPVRTSPLPHTCYMPRPSHYSRFYQPNNIGWGVQSLSSSKVAR